MWRGKKHQHHSHTRKSHTTSPAHLQKTRTPGQSSDDGLAVGKRRSYE